MLCLTLELVPLSVTPCPQRGCCGVRVVERHHLGQRVAPEVTKPSTDVSSGLADVWQGFMADDTDTIDTRAGG